MPGRWKWRWGLAAGVMLVATGCVSRVNEHGIHVLESHYETTRLHGLAYRLRELTEPRPNRVHVLRVDLAGGQVRPAVVLARDPDRDGPAEAALTSPMKLAGDPTVLAFVNTNPWDDIPGIRGRKNRLWHAGQRVDIHGLAVSSGQVRSTARSTAACVWFDDEGRVCLGGDPVGRAVEGVAGFQPVVRDGAVVVKTGGAVHPRTAIGVDMSGQVMWLVVVDGRQEGYSEGMSLHELGFLMRDLGCRHATNMDGGGSSVMGLAGVDGRLRVVNSPSDRILGVLRRTRPLPMVLTIRREEVPRPSPARADGKATD